MRAIRATTAMRVKGGGGGGGCGGGLKMPKGLLAATAPDLEVVPAVAVGVCLSGGIRVSGSEKFRFAV